MQKPRDVASLTVLFAGQGQVIMSVQNGGQKWKEHDKITTIANFETAVA